MAAEAEPRAAAAAEPRAVAARAREGEGFEGEGEGEEGGEGEGDNGAPAVASLSKLDSYPTGSPYVLWVQVRGAAAFWMQLSHAEPQCSKRSVQARPVARQISISQRAAAMLLTQMNLPRSRCP